jgi:hypothetical protein
VDFNKIGRVPALTEGKVTMTAPGTAREEHEAMEFSVTKSALLNELSTTQGVVERKTTIHSFEPSSRPKEAA